MSKQQWSPRRKTVSGFDGLNSKYASRGAFESLPKTSINDPPGTGLGFPEKKNDIFLAYCLGNSRWFQKSKRFLVQLPVRYYLVWIITLREVGEQRV